MRIIVFLHSLFFLASFLWGAPEDYFAIEVVDAETGRGIPMVRVRTVNLVDHWTDSAGRVAFLEPGLMGEEVYFHLESDGYEYPADGFGYRGFRVKVLPGRRHRVEMERRMIAERLYRLTGGGIYRDSVLLGEDVPVREPVLNGLVLGQDSVLAVPYRGKVFWLWGDTSRPAYPLGNFHVSMATSAAPEELKPETGIDFRYFVDEAGFAKEMAKMEGKGPTWLSALTAVSDGEREVLVAAYAKVLPTMEAYERGIVVFDDEREVFEHYSTFEEGIPVYPHGHVMRLEEGGEAYLYFMGPLPFLRAKADFGSMIDLGGYEAFTPLKEGSGAGSGEIERDSEGRVVWGWKRGTAEVGAQEELRLVKAGVLAEEERLSGIREWRTGRQVVLHAGSISWNRYRERWILIANEIGGDSLLGEVWFAEADSPLGPWAYAEKIVTHEKYSFYNLRHHPFLDRDEGKTIFFEGTYSALFSGEGSPTPRYDYNQILYRLDLSDRRLDLPVAFYRTEEGKVSSANGVSVIGRPLFWAWEKPGRGRIGVRSVTSDGVLRFEESEEGEFYVAGEELEIADAVSGFEEEGEFIDLPGKVLPDPHPRGPVLVPVRPE